MLFRVTLSNDVNEYYKENPNDTQMSLTVEASSFNNAMLTAQALMVSLVFWPGMFEVVAVRKLDEPEIEDQPQPFYGNVGVAEKLGVKEPVKKAPEIWCLDTGIQILDPDGWDRRNYEISWYEPITREDFIERARMSTCYAWPQPLYDEDPHNQEGDFEDCGDDSWCDEPRCPSYRKYD